MPESQFQGFQNCGGNLNQPAESLYPFGISCHVCHHQKRIVVYLYKKIASNTLQIVQYLFNSVFVESGGKNQDPKLPVNQLDIQR